MGAVPRRVTVDPTVLPVSSDPAAGRHRRSAVGAGTQVALVAIPSQVYVLAQAAAPVGGRARRGGAARRRVAARRGAPGRRVAAVAGAGSATSHDERLHTAT